jgi:2-polyprenyl-6-methoxyphenol hydroxylase-like FAD-dependent oxidoreductase
MLSLLLARAGVPVVLLELHHDFERDFRGDTVHPSTLEVLDQIGLADSLHGLAHTKARGISFVTPERVYRMAVFERLPTRFPYVMILPQSRFLELLVEEARRYPHFRLILGANAQELVEAGGSVRGVRYRAAGGLHEVIAPLVVGADGRFSRVRKLAGLEPVAHSPPMQVVWLRVPRHADDLYDEATINVGRTGVVVLLGRVDQWQIGYATSEEGFRTLRAAGMEALREAIESALPWLADRLAALDDWHQVNVLSVAGSRVERWHRPGLLLLGDAAHVMLPVGGVGINLAVSDAVEAANVLTAPLRAGGVSDDRLAEVQRRRERVTRIVQRFQTVMQRRVVPDDAGSRRAFRPPLPVRVMLRVPGLRDLPARVMAFGVRRVRVERPEEAAART